MSFLFPAVLGGLAAISIPIAIHLLNKFRVRTIDWAAMKFLLEGMRRNERRVKLQDLLLLILRCVFVALLFLAFARPVLKELAAGTADSSGPVATAVVLDNSASMTQSDAVQNRFEQARQEIQSWLDSRDPQSVTALCLVSNRAQPLIPQPTADLAIFRKMLESARPTDRGSDLAEGIRFACQTLAETGSKQREVRVYSDNQTAAWSQLEEIRKLAAEYPEIAFRPAQIGKSGEENLGVIDLRPVGGVPSAGQPCRMRVEIGNYSSQPAENVSVTLEIDGTPSGQSQLPPIAPGATQAVEIVLNFPETGPRIVTARIPPDAFALDNERATAVNVVRRMNVLIVEGAPAEEMQDREGYFLANALVPLPPEQASQYYLACRFVSVAELDAAALSDATAVFFANAVEPPTETAKLLREYVNRGGNMVVFPGPQTDPARWKGSEWADLLPADVGAIRVAEEGKPLAWQSRDFEHLVTSLWNDPSQGSLGSVQVSQYFPLTPKANSAVIARLENSDRAIVEWEQGQGRVVLFNSTATPIWTNLPLHPGFVALLQRLMGYLDRSAQARLVLAPGEPFTVHGPPEWRGRDFSVQAPGVATPHVIGQIGFEEGKAVIRFSATEKVGGYRVFVDQEPVAAFAVQLDPKESDLRQVEPAGLENPAEPSRIATERRMVVSREFWTPLIWLALAVAVIEAALAHRFSFAR